MFIQNWTHYVKSFSFNELGLFRVKKGLKYAYVYHHVNFYSSRQFSICKHGYESYGLELSTIIGKFYVLDFFGHEFNDLTHFTYGPRTLKRRYFSYYKS